MLGVLKGKSPSAGVCAFADGDFCMCLSMIKHVLVHETSSQTKQVPPNLCVGSGGLPKMAATYFPTGQCSIIGVHGLNFSVRNGKRWNPVAITTLISFCSHWLSFSTREKAFTTYVNKPQLKYFEYLFSRQCIYKYIQLAASSIYDA